METTMLVIDDDEMNRDILKILFEKKYAILEAESGKEGLDVLRSCSGNIDVVLLDLMMDDISGFDLLEQRKDLDFFKDVPVVVITGSESMEDQIKSFRLGANDYINKPFVPEIVISRVNNVLASHRRFISIELEAQRLKIKSELDQMTGLYNKTTVEAMIAEKLKIDKEKMCALFVIDVDNFKSINDTSGHLAGDHVIKIIADLISSHFRKSDIIGRIGGDEFIVMMVDVPSMEIVYSKVNELIQLMRYKPNLTIPENVTLSIGIACNYKHAIEYEELFHRADEALYRAKEDGKACYREYGVTPLELDEDDRPVVFLFSRNRSVCSIIHAMMPPEIKIVEILSYGELHKMKESDIKKCAIFFTDISECDGDCDAFWTTLKKCEWIRFPKVIALCEEGHMEQYKSAIMNGVGDLLATPLDSGAVKRCILRKIK